MSKLIEKAGAWLIGAVLASVAMVGPASATATYEGRFQGFLHLAGISDSAGVPLTSVPDDVLIEAFGNASGFAGIGGSASAGSNLSAQVCRIPLNFGCPISLATAPFFNIPLPMDLTGGFPQVGGMAHTHDGSGVADGSSGFDEAPQSSAWGTSEVNIANLSNGQQAYTIDFELIYVYSLATSVDDAANELASMTVEAILRNLPDGDHTLVSSFCDSTVHGAACSEAGGGGSIFVTSPAPLTYGFSVVAGPASSRSISLSVNVTGAGFSPAAQPNGVPVPPTIVLAALGLAGLGWGRRKAAVSTPD